MEQTRWIKPDGTNSTSSKASQVDDVLLYPVSIQTLSPPYQGCYNLHVTLLSPYNPDEQSPYNPDKQQLIPVPNCTTEGECARSRPILPTHTYRTRTVPWGTRTVPYRAVPVPCRTRTVPYRAVHVIPATQGDHYTGSTEYCPPLRDLLFRHASLRCEHTTVLLIRNSYRRMSNHRAKYIHTRYIHTYQV